MRTKMSVLAALLVAVLAGGSLAGCAGGGSGGTVSPGDSVAPSSIGPVSPPPGGSTPSGKTTELTLAGLPQPGVEAGCIVMQSGGTLYLLLGGDRQLLSSGRQVEVRGTPAPGLMSICQQGTPFQVTEVRAA